MPVQEGTAYEPTIRALRASGVVEKIILVGKSHSDIEGIDIGTLVTDGFGSTKALKAFAREITTDYLLLYTKMLPLDLGQNALKRMIQVSQSSGAGMVYTDYFEQKEGVLKPHPVIDIQDGSLRDDFDFGSLMLYRTDTFVDAAKRMDEEFEWAGLYENWIRVCRVKKCSIMSIHATG